MMERVLEMSAQRRAGRPNNGSSSGQFSFFPRFHLSLFSSSFRSIQVHDRVSLHSPVMAHSFPEAQV
jgi:hypothetical protein